MNNDSRELSAIEKFIISSKWMLIPFYTGLILTLGQFTVSYFGLIFESLSSFTHYSKNEVILQMLEVIDVVMIANLAKMIIVGSYNSFVKKFPSEMSENISSGMLKIKMSTSLIGVSSIHLLKDFISAEHLPWDVLYKQLAIHTAFIVGALALSFMEYLHNKTKVAH